MGSCFSAALINSGATDMNSGTLPFTMAARTGVPGRGHEQPPLAIVCGRNEFFIKKLPCKIFHKFKKIFFRILPAPSRSRPPRGLLAPPLRRGMGVCTTRWTSSALEMGHYHNTRDFLTLCCRLWPAPSRSHLPRGLLVQPYRRSVFARLSCSRSEPGTPAPRSAFLSRFGLVPRPIMDPAVMGLSGDQAVCYATRVPDVSLSLHMSKHSWTYSARAGRTTPCPPLWPTPSL